MATCCFAPPDRLCRSRGAAQPPSDTSQAYPGKAMSPKWHGSRLAHRFATHGRHSAFCDLVLCRPCFRKRSAFEAKVKSMHKTRSVPFRATDPADRAHHAPTFGHKADAANRKAPRSQYPDLCAKPASEAARGNAGAAARFPPNLINEDAQQNLPSQSDSRSTRRLIVGTASLSASIGTRRNAASAILNHLQGVKRMRGRTLHPRIPTQNVLFKS